MPVGIVIKCCAPQPVPLAEELVQKMMTDVPTEVILRFAAAPARVVKAALGETAEAHKFLGFLTQFQGDTTFPQPDHAGGQPLPPPPPPPPTATGTDQSGGTAVPSPAAEDTLPDYEDTRRKERHSPTEPGNGAVETDGNQEPCIIIEYQQEPGIAVASPAAEDAKKDIQAEDDKKDNQEPGTAAEDAKKDKQAEDVKKATQLEERHSPTEAGSEAAETDDNQKPQAAAETNRMPNARH